MTEVEGQAKENINIIAICSSNAEAVCGRASAVHILVGFHFGTFGTRLLVHMSS